MDCRPHRARSSSDVATWSSIEAPSNDDDQAGDDQGWQPDPEQLAFDHAETPFGEEGADAQRRDHDRPDWKEVARVVEGGEERDAGAAVGQRVEHAVRG